MNKLKSIIDKLTKRHYEKKALRNLLSKKQEDLAIFEILESYLAEIVVSGDEARRKELAQMQMKIEENMKFIEFIKKIK